MSCILDNYRYNVKLTATADPLSYQFPEDVFEIEDVRIGGSNTPLGEFIPPRLYRLNTALPACADVFSDYFAKVSDCGC